MSNYLYRGVNIELHNKLKGALRPKQQEPFTKSFNWDEFQWDNFYWDENENNAVIEHQRHQAGYPTSGLSTTPKIERAEFYATAGGKYESGVIYVIDPVACKAVGVKLFVVREIVPSPSVPEDEEVILVAKNFGDIPNEVVVEVRYI